jgi:hypothetical protein
MPKSLPFDVFLRRARAIHGERYDYAQAAQVWVDTKHKIPIVCPIHGVFEQLPNNHLNGFGCAKCGGARMGAARRLDPEEIARRLHARFPHYDLVPDSYRGVNARATWRCARHGIDFVCSFEYVVHDGFVGCPICRQEAAHAQRAAERQDPHAEAHLAYIAQTLGSERAHLYRRWLAGEALRELARGSGVSHQAMHMRIVQVRELIRAEDAAGGPESAAPGTGGSETADH